MDTRIYLVRNGTAEHLVRATHPSRAIAHVVEQMGLRAEVVSSHTPGRWRCEAHGDGHHIIADTVQWTKVATVHAMRADDAQLIAAAPDLLALAHQYASECGECAGTRVMPDDEPCLECADIWEVITKAEGRS